MTIFAILFLMKLQMFLHRFFVAVILGAFVFSMTSTVFAAEPTYSWTKTIGDTQYDYARASAVDSSGNVYIAGTFTGTVDFDPSGTTEEYTSATTEVYITSYDANGSYRWTRVFDGNTYNAVNDITTDTNGRVILTGSFQGTSDFNTSGAGGDYAAQATDGYAVVLGNDGSYVGAVPLGSAGSDTGQGVSVDPQTNSFVVTGTFGAALDFDLSGDTHSLTPVGGLDIFLARYTSSLTYEWAHAFGGAGNEGVGDSVTDSSGNSYVICGFANSIDINPDDSTEQTVSSNGDDDMCIVKVNANGAFSWGRTIGGDGYDYMEGIAASSNALYLTGGYASSSIDFNPTDGTDTQTSDTTDNIFLTKLNLNGTYGWTRVMGTSGYEWGQSVITNSAGDPILTGSFDDTVDFDGTDETDSHTSVGGDDAFITEYEADGDYAWTMVFGTTTSEGPYGVSASPSDKISVIGHFLGTVDFDPTDAGTDSIASQGNTDAFVITLQDSVDASAPTVTVNSVTTPTSASSVVMSGTATDTLKNVASVSYQNDRTIGTWTSCTPSDSSYDSVSEAFSCSLTGLTDGSHTVYFRSCDVKPNCTSSGYTSAAFTVDTQSPTGFEIGLSENEKFAPETHILATNVKIPRLYMSISDAGSGVTEMKITEDSNVSTASWRTYSSVAEYNFTSGSGTKTVYFVFRDAAGNESVRYKQEFLYAEFVGTGNTDPTSTSTTSTSPTPSPTTVAARLAGLFGSSAQAADGGGDSDETSFAESIGNTIGNAVGKTAGAVAKPFQTAADTVKDPKNGTARFIVFAGSGVGLGIGLFLLILLLMRRRDEKREKNA
jgi:hypothetical protein